MGFYDESVLRYDNCVPYSRVEVFFFVKKRTDMSVLATIGVIGGLLSAGYGAYKSSKSAKEEKEAMAQQRAVNQAWYDRNYYQDYLNTVEAQNAVKRYKDAWGERLSEERARQVISGGTPAQLAAVQEAGAEGMANLMGDLAATGEQRKQAVEEQKLAMDNNMSEREMALARAKQEAGANLMQNGIGVATSSLQAFGTPKAGATRVNTPDVIGKEAGIYPGLVVPENDYYSKNKKYY